METNRDIAERVYPIEDRLQQVSLLKPRLRNIDQRIKRNHAKASEALHDWFKGDQHALVDYERCAERIQLDVSARDAVVKDIERLTSEDWFHG